MGGKKCEERKAKVREREEGRKEYERGGGEVDGEEYEREEVGKNMREGRRKERIGDCWKERI